jgi:hypothetical protein
MVLRSERWLRTRFRRVQIQIDEMSQRFVSLTKDAQ